MGFKIDQKEIIAVLLVFLLALGAGQLPLKSTLPDFIAAKQIQSSLAGKAEPFHIQLASMKESFFAAILGAPANFPGAIASFLMLFAPLLLAISSVFLYLSLRSLELRRTVSAFGALLYALSLVSLSFLPGMYGPGQLAALFFSIFLFLLCQFSKGKSLMIIPAAAAVALSCYTSASFGPAAIAAVLSFAAHEYIKEGKRLLQFALLLAVAAACMFLSPAGSLRFSLEGAKQLLVVLPFVIASAFCTAVLFFSARESLRDFLLLLFGILAAVFSPIAGGMVLVLSAALGMDKASGEKASRPLMLACAFFIAFFGVTGLAMIVGTDLYTALVAATMVSVLAPLFLHFYEYRSQQLFSAAALCLVALSLFLLLFYSLPPQRPLYPAYADSDLTGALLSLYAKSPGQISLESGQAAASFYLPSAKQAGLSTYVSSGKGVPDSGSLLLLSLADLDAGSFGEGAASYAFAGNFTSQRGPAVFFVSSDGLLAVRDIALDGSLMLSDGTLLDSSGAAYATVPLSRMVLLRKDIPFDSAKNRLVVLDEGTPLPYFMKIYSGEASELEKVSEFGKVSIFKVK